jgi:hypothetical protein
MTKYFDDVFDGLKRAGQLAADAVNRQQQATELSRQASELTTQAVGELVAVADAAIHAHDEEEDLRVTVDRLEKLVIELVRRLPPSDAIGKVN